MISVNKTVLLLFIFFIKIVCVTCTECEDEISEEFDNDEPLEDFLYGFFNIKYDNVFWDENTNVNEKIYRGFEILKKTTTAYYNELFTVATEMGLPDLLTPQDFCSAEHGGEEDACTSAIEAIGCRAYLSGTDCFEKMYYRWRMSSELDDAMPGTEDLTNDELLEAIGNGSYEFRFLSDDELFHAFSSRTDLMQELSDENLLREFYRRLYEENHMFWEGHPNNRYDSYPLRDDDFYETSAFNEFVRVHFNNVVQPQMREIYDRQMLHRARVRSYGISELPFEVICAEYQRRKILPKFFDNLYALNICDKIRASTWNTSYFLNRKDFCEKYFPEEK